MKKSVFLILLVTFFLFVISANGDVPPDPGQKRITLKLIVESLEDLSDYRFFLKTGAELKEYVFKKGEKLTIESMGGGAFYRNGKFLAVPKKALVDLSETPTDGELNALQQAIYDGKVLGVINLIDHSFIRDVPNADAKNWSDPVYRIEKDDVKGIKAVLVSGGKNESKVAASSYWTDPKSPAFWVTVGGGSLMTLAFIFFGVWAIRRSNRPRQMDAAAK